MSKPSLQEIADMPFPASRDALNKHYGTPEIEPDDESQTYRVRVHYTCRVEGSKTYEVVAKSDEEAEELASDKFDDEADNDWEFDYAEVVSA